jgi:hypothetical protein
MVPMAHDETSGGPPPGELDAVFDGTCTLEIPGVEGAPPLDHYPLRCDIRFSADRRTVWVIDFEPITTPEYQARLGPLTVTNETKVHLKSAEPGRFGEDGHVSVAVVLHFDHLFDAPFYEEDSDLPLLLRSDAPGGAPLDGEGRLALVGEGTFVGGALHRKACRLTYEGRVSPLPW